MGEIADGLINGDFDYITGEYLGEGFGFPRTANDFKARKKQQKEYWNSLSEEEKEVRRVYTKIMGKEMAQIRMRNISEFLHKELGMSIVPKKEEQYKIVYDNLEKFKQYLKHILDS